MPSKYLSSLLFLFYIIFLISIICAFRAVSSMSIGAILLTGMIKNRTENGALYNRRMNNIFLIGCCLYYLFVIIALLYTTDRYEGWKHVESKSALIVVPLAACCCSYLNSDIRKKLMIPYIAALVIITLYCLANAFIRYHFHHDDLSVFFYHALVSPFQHHAIQFSILVFVGLIYLLEATKKEAYFYNRVLHIGIVLYFIFFIVLLSSKLVIAFSVIYLLNYFFTFLRSARSGRLLIGISIFGCLSLIAAVMLTQNPISSRYREIMTDNLSVVQQKKFNPGNYFNGVQFRLLQWRFVKEILEENNAWLLGVSPGNSQQLLNQKYISANMYIGSTAGHIQGFLGYNAHNEFLESVLQIGIAGLLAFVPICIGMIKMAIRRKNIELSSVVILLLLYACNESVLETQYGMSIFLFFPLFLYYGTESRNLASPSA